MFNPSNEGRMSVYGIDAHTCLLARALESAVGRSMAATGSDIITTIGVNGFGWAWRMMQVIPAPGQEG